MNLINVQDEGIGVLIRPGEIQELFDSLKDTIRLSKYNSIKVQELYDILSGTIKKNEEKEHGEK